MVRLDALNEVVQKNLFPIDLPKIDCENLKNGHPELKMTLEQVKFYRENGAKNCAFQLLEMLKNESFSTKKGQLQWLEEATKTLSRFEVLDSAIAMATQFRALAEQENSSKTEAWLAEANARDQKLQFWETFALAEKALENARAAGDKKLEAAALEIISGSTRDIYQTHPEKSIPPLLEALKIYEELRDTSQIIRSFTGLAIHFYDSDIEKAVGFLERAAALANRQSKLNVKMSVIRMLSICYDFVGEKKKSLDLIFESVKISKHLGNRSLTQNIYEHIAGNYLSLGDANAAQQFYDSAWVYCSFERQLGYFYRGLGETAAARGDLKKANEWFLKAFDEQTKSYNERNTVQLSEWETRFRTRETALQLEAQKRQRWLLFGLVFAFAALFAGAVFAFFQQKKSREKLTTQNQIIEKQTAELRRLDEAKSRFFANVSHELRTPLTLMLGPLGSMLKRNRLENIDFTHAKTAQQHGKQLLNLVNEILDLSKIESGKMKMQETTVSFQPFLRRLVSSFESHAERLGIRFVFEYRVADRLRVQLDEDKLTKVVNNLLSNALKFTPPQTGQVKVVAEEFENRIRISVHDTGRGIHPDDLPHVFERFYQTEQANAPIEGGTGIGLALCREFAELMQGKIWATSPADGGRWTADGQPGSVFHFEFPKKEVLGVLEEAAFVIQEEPVPTQHDTDGFLLNDKNNGKKAATQSKNQPNNQPIILLVEDNDSLRDYVKLILSEKYQVFTAANGQEALTFLTSKFAESIIPHSSFLILSDVMMPVMDGFQMVEKLKNDDRWRGIPVVMLTARADLRDKLKALRIGVDDYLLKPFEEEELLARIENLLKNASQRVVNEDFKSENETPSDDPEIVNRLALGETKILNPADLEWLAELEKVVLAEVGNSILNVDFLADRMLLSRTKFFQEVKRLVGMTPNEYILEVRFSTARNLLETRRATSVKSAAGAVGFRDVEYFSRQFRAKFGKSPSDYLG